MPTAEPVNPQKQEVLLALHQVCWSEMTWRRNAGYRTVILGLGYCGVLLTLVATSRPMNIPVRGCLAAVIALATLFGAGYLTRFVWIKRKLWDSSGSKLNCR